MNTIDYHKVGEEFEYNGRKFVPVDTCDLCDLKDECYNTRAMNCVCDQRLDCKDVIYKEVNRRKEKGLLLLNMLSILFLIVCAAVVVSLLLNGQYLFGLMFLLCCVYIATDAWVNGRKSK